MNETKKQQDSEDDMDECSPFHILVTGILENMLYDACRRCENEENILKNACCAKFMEYTNEQLEKALLDLRAMKGIAENINIRNQETNSPKSEILEREISTIITYPVHAIHADVAVQRNSQLIDKITEISQGTCHTSTQISTDNIKLNMHTSTANMLPEVIEDNALGSESLLQIATLQNPEKQIAISETDNTSTNLCTASYAFKSNLKIKPIKKNNNVNTFHKNYRSLSKYNKFRSESHRSAKGIHPWTILRQHSQITKKHFKLVRNQLGKETACPNKASINKCSVDNNSTGREESLEGVSNSEFYARADDINADIQRQSDNTDDDNSTEEFMYEDVGQSNTETSDTDNNHSREEDAESIESYNTTNIIENPILLKQSILNISVSNKIWSQNEKEAKILNNSMTEPCISEVPESNENDIGGHENYNDLDIDEIAQNLRQTLYRSEQDLSLSTRNLKNHKQMLQRLSSAFPQREIISNSSEDLINITSGMQIDNCDSLSMESTYSDEQNDQSVLKSTSSIINIKNSGNLENFATNLNKIDEHDTVILDSKSEVNFKPIILNSSTSSIEELIKMDNYKYVITASMLRILETQKMLQLLRCTIPYNKNTLPLFVSPASSVIKSVEEMKKSEPTIRSKSDKVSLLSKKTAFAVGITSGVSANIFNSISLSALAFFEGPCEFTNHNNDENQRA